MKLSKREKTLFIATVVAVLLGVLSQTPLLQTAQALKTSQSDVDSAIKTFKNDQERLAAGADIIKQYKEIEDQFPQLKQGQKAEYQFSEDVDRLCKSLDFKYPTIDPPERQDIPDVEEYQFITVNVRTSGKFSSVSKLLKGFAEKKLIIKEVNLKHTIDNDNVHIIVRVARIAKAEKADDNAKKKTSLRK